jgi:two-component system, NtrC family, response regulator HydG
MGKRLKVLIVDDNIDLCRNIADILDFKGYEVTCVYDGSQAIDEYLKRSFDMVIMDVKMPGFNGLEVLKVLKQINPQVIVILITAFADDVLFKEDIESSRYTVFRKPIDVDKLINLLERLNPGRNNVCP